MEEKRRVAATIVSLIEVLKGYAMRVEKCHGKRCVEDEARSLASFLRRFADELEVSLR